MLFILVCLQFEEFPTSATGAATKSSSNGRPVAELIGEKVLDGAAEQPEKVSILMVLFSSKHSNTHNVM